MANVVVTMEQSKRMEEARLALVDLSQRLIEKANEALNDEAKHQEAAALSNAAASTLETAAKIVRFDCWATSE